MFFCTRRFCKLFCLQRAGRKDFGLIPPALPPSRPVGPICLIPPFCRSYLPHSSHPVGPIWPLLPHSSCLFGLEATLHRSTRAPIAFNSSNSNSTCLIWNRKPKNHHSGLYTSNFCFIFVQKFIRYSFTVRKAGVSHAKGWGLLSKRLGSPMRRPLLASQFLASPYHHHHHFFSFFISGE